MADLTIAERSVAGVTVLELHGRLVIEDAEARLQECINRLVEQGRVHIVLNLASVMQVDSAGIGALAAKYVSVRRKGGDLKLAALTARTAHLMAITRLSTVFEIFESEDDAVRSFAPASV